MTSTCESRCCSHRCNPSHADACPCKATTHSTRSRRVTSSRTSVSSWSTSTRLRPRRPAPRSSRTRWRPAVSRTRYVLYYILLLRPLSFSAYRRPASVVLRVCWRRGRLSLLWSTMPPSGSKPDKSPSSPIRPPVPFTYQYAVSYAMRLTPVRQAHARMFFHGLSMSRPQHRADPGLIPEVETRQMYTMYNYLCTCSSA